MKFADALALWLDLLIWWVLSAFLVVLPFWRTVSDWYFYNMPWRSAWYINMGAWWEITCRGPEAFEDLS